MAFTVERFDHIVLHCRDVNATAAWYERVLGMRRETFGPSRRTALRFGDQKINLRPVGASSDDPEWFTGSVEAAGSEDLCFITRASPDDARAHLAACGVEVISGPVTKAGALGAMTSRYCRDNDGNLIEIAVYCESVSGYSAGRLITMASWLLRAITTSAVVSGSGFSSRCGRYGGMKT